MTNDQRALIMAAVTVWNEKRNNRSCWDYNPTLDASTFAEGITVGRVTGRIFRAHDAMSMEEAEKLVDDMLMIEGKHVIGFFKQMEIPR